MSGECVNFWLYDKFLALSSFLSASVEFHAPAFLLVIGIIAIRGCDGPGASSTSPLFVVMRRPQFPIGGVVALVAVNLHPNNDTPPTPRQKHADQALPRLRRLGETV